MHCRELASDKLKSEKNHGITYTHFFLKNSLQRFRVCFQECFNCVSCVFQIHYKVISASFKEIACCILYTTLPLYSVLPYLYILYYPTYILYTTLHLYSILSYLYTLFYPTYILYTTLSLYSILPNLYTLFYPTYILYSSLPLYSILYSTLLIYFILPYLYTTPPKCIFAFRITPVIQL